MNIKREFLYNEDKFIPLQLLRTNYGISDVNPSIFSNPTISEKTSVNLDIRFPYNSSNVAVLIDVNSNNILDIKATTPNESIVTLKLNQGITYNIYIISREYIDGYISEQYSIDEDAQRANFTLDGNLPQSIDLSLDGRMTESNGRNEKNEWYGYNGTYNNSTLIWEYPSDIRSTIGNENYWLIVRDGIYKTIDNIFKNRDLTSFQEVSIDDINTKIKTVKMFAVMSDIAEYMKDNIPAIEEELGTNSSNLQEIWTFLNANLPGFSSIGERSSTFYNDYDLELHNKIDELSVYGDFIDVGYWNINTEQSRRDNGQFIAGTNGGAINGIGSLTQSNMYNGQFEYGTAGRSLISGIWAGIPYVTEPPSLIPWDTYNTAMIQFDNRKRSNINQYNETLNSYGLPAWGTNRTQYQQWWTDYGTNSRELFTNIRNWLENKMTQSKLEMAQIGDLVFLNLSSGSTVGRNFPHDYGWDGPIPETPSGITSSDWTELFSGIQEIVDMGGDQPILNPDPINAYKGLARWTNTLTWYAYYVWYKSMESRNTVVENPDIPTTISGNTIQLAHEATLQNIRFIKNLLNSMDENMWASHTNTNTLILSSLINLQNIMKNDKSKSTITNITTSHIRNGSIEILWKKSTDQDWRTDSLTIEDIGNDVKLLNMNQINEIGKYFVLVRPLKITGNISEVIDDYVIVNDSPQFNEGISENYFYGYNCQILKQDGSPVDVGIKVIVESALIDGNRQYLKLSPSISSVDSFGENSKISVWSNEFIPTIIEVDIVEHNALTLSYSMYAKKEMDIDTGLCKIYDYNGNVYKTLTFGKYSNPTTLGHIIEYRIPTEDET